MSEKLSINLTVVIKKTNFVYFATIKELPEVCTQTFSLRDVKIEIVQALKIYLWLQRYRFDESLLMPLETITEEVKDLQFELIKSTTTNPEKEEVTNLGKIPRSELLAHFRNRSIFSDKKYKKLTKATILRRDINGLTKICMLPSGSILYHDIVAHVCTELGVDLPKKFT